MKKVLCVIIGLILFAVTFVACFDAKDFEFDKFTISDLEPTVYLPLVNDTVRLDANNDYNVWYDEEGVGYLHFDIESDILPSVETFFDVPDATVTVPGTSFNYPGGVTPSTPVIILPQTYTVTYDFQDDQQIDSIVFKRGDLTFNLAAPSGFGGSYTITIPELKDTTTGTPFSVTVPFGASLSNQLSGYILRFGADNAFDVVIGLTIASASAIPNNYQFNAGITFEDIEVKEVHGYFGQKTLDVIPVSMNIPTFDQFRNNNSTVLQIKEAFLDFRVDNGAGFPIQLRIDEVISKVNGGNTNNRSMVDSVNIPANLKPQNSYLRSERNIGGEAFGAVLSNMPSQVDFKFSGTINPEGSKGGTVKNFLTDASSITVSNIRARIPLNFRVSDMVLEDTLNFNSSKVTFNDMELLLNVENSMPVSVTLQAFLMDEQGILLRDKEGNQQALFKDRVSIPAATVDDATGRVTEPFLYHPKENIEANVKMLEQTKKIKVEITVASNPDSEFVRVTKDNYVYLRIGAKSKVNIDNLD